MLEKYPERDIYIKHLDMIKEELKNKAAFPTVELLMRFRAEFHYVLKEYNETAQCLRKGLKEAIRKGSLLMQLHIKQKLAVLLFNKSFLNNI